MSKSTDIPFETTLLVRDTCLCLHVQRAARVLARRFDEALKPVGLTNGQFSLLMSLNRPAPETETAGAVVGVGGGSEGASAREEAAADVRAGVESGAHSGSQAGTMAVPM